MSAAAPRIARPGLLASYGAPLIFALAGFCFYLLRVTDGFSAVPGDLGDARFNSVILEHLYQRLRDVAPSLWSPPFFYPAFGALAFSDAHFGSGGIYILLRLAGLGRELAFDGWFAIGCAFNFLAMYGVMRKLAFGTVASAVAAFIYTFGLPALAQEGHAQLVWRFAIPLAWLSLIQFAQDRRIQRLAQLAIWGTVQVYCSIYLGVFLAYLLAATMLTLAVSSLRPARAATSTQAEGCGGPASRAALAATMLVLAGCAVATAVLLAKYQTVSSGYAFVRSAEEIMSMIPRPWSYILADRVPAYGWLTQAVPGHSHRHEHQLFIGLAPLALCLLALAGLRSREPGDRRRLLSGCLATLFLLVAFTLQIGDASLYHFVMRAPGVSSIRAVSRVILVMLLPVAVIAAIGAEQVQLRVRPRWLGTGLLALVLSVETWAYQPSSAPIDQWRSRLAVVEAAARDRVWRPDSVVYLTGVASEPSFLVELDAMMFAQDRGIATLNGYSGNAPPGYLDARACTSPEVHIRTLAEFLFVRRGITRDDLLSRTLWLRLEPCAASQPVKP